MRASFMAPLVLLVYLAPCRFVLAASSQLFSLDVLTQVPSIQQTAALALGRLASYSDDLAEAVVANEILPQLVYSLGEQNVSISSI